MRMHALHRRGRGVAAVREDVKLDAVFREFMSSANHMLLVRASQPWQPAEEGGAPEGPVVGLITLEDVLEEVIQVDMLEKALMCFAIFCHSLPKIAIVCQVLGFSRGACGKGGKELRVQCRSRHRAWLAHFSSTSCVTM